MTRHDKRNYNWKHTSLIGSACRGQVDMRRICNSESATQETKKLAYKIAADMRLLTTMVRNSRVNQDGTTSHIKRKSPQ